MITTLEEALKRISELEAENANTEVVSLLADRNMMQLGRSHIMTLLSNLKVA